MPIDMKSLAIGKQNGGGGGDITTEKLSVTKNGTYTAPQGKAYTPVEVDVSVGEIPFADIKISNTVMVYYEEGTKTLHIWGEGGNTKGWSSYKTDYLEVENIDVKHGVSALLNDCFGGYTLKELHIPKTCNTIKQGAFRNTTVEKVFFYGTDSEWCSIARDANATTAFTPSTHFYINDELVTGITVTAESVTVNAFNGYKFLTSAYLDVKSIGSSAFNDCSSLETLVFGNNLTTIVTYAFNGCNLKRVVIPSSVTQIDTRAFRSNANSEVYDFTNISLVNGVLPITFGQAVFDFNSANFVILFANQEIADVAKMTTNLVQFATHIHYVGEEY